MITNSPNLKGFKIQINSDYTELRLKQHRLQQSFHVLIFFYLLLTRFLKKGEGKWVVAEFTISFAEVKDE